MSLNLVINNNYIMHCCFACREFYHAHIVTSIRIGLDNPLYLNLNHVIQTYPHAYNATVSAEADKTIDAVSYLNSLVGKRT